MYVNTYFKLILGKEKTTSLEVVWRITHQELAGTIDELN